MCNPGYSWKSEITDLGEDETGIEGVEDMLKLANLTVTFGENESLSYVLSSIIVKSEAGN